MGLCGSNFFVANKVLALQFKLCTFENITAARDFCIFVDISFFVCFDAACVAPPSATSQSATSNTGRASGGHRVGGTE